MKICFRPFGVGFEDVDTEEVKAHLKKGWARTKELTAVAIEKSKPHVLNAAEVTLRHTANGVCFVANALADAHDAVSKKQAQ